MFTTEIKTEITRIARTFDLEPAALLAVAEVESGGKVFALVDGRHEPLIRFEGHYFDRRLSQADREIARRAGLASPTAGAVANPRSQAARWKMLAQAQAIDRRAAHEATSWGLGQVMGAHWAWLGFADVDALVAEARSGAAGQARLMARYIVKSGLAPAIRRRDWESFARGYNGPGFARNAYHLKVAAAFRRHADATAHGTQDTDAPLRHGSTGTVVADLQRTLSALGYPLDVDGKFGPATSAAVKNFQKDHGLAADGIVDIQTRRALSDAMPTGSTWRRLWAALKCWSGEFLFWR